MDEKLPSFNPDWDQVLEQLEANEQSAIVLSAEETLLLAELRKLRDEAGKTLKIYQSFNTDKRWADFRLQAGIDKEAQHSAGNRSYRLWLRISAAAAAIIIVLGAGIFYFRQENSRQILVNDIRNDIAPGKNNAATLTLGNGRKILLSAAAKGQLAREAGIMITKTIDGQVIYSVQNQDHLVRAKANTLSTSVGETYRLRLPDQSEVWLNASSSIKFPASFAGQHLREVELNGEAYFEIAKDKAHPFIVKTEQQEIQVLGTHFNINSYGDKSSTITTLLEGSLRVLNAVKKSEVIKPGEQSVVDRKEKIIISKADVKQAMAWKNGYFRFREERIDRIMLEISRWYAIEVSYQGELPTEKFSGNISRYKNISEVLNMLSYSNAVKFKVEGRRVTVMQ